MTKKRDKGQTKACPQSKLDGSMRGEKQSNGAKQAIEGRSQQFYNLNASQNCISRMS